jgi:hypothetical protein
LAAVMAGGDFVDPVSELFAELEEKPVAQPDRELRKALGLST